MARHSDREVAVYLDSLELVPVPRAQQLKPKEENALFIMQKEANSQLGPVKHVQQ